MPEKRRADAVLCVEHFFGASPEWWQSASTEEQGKFFDRGVEWLNQTYGRENVVYFGTQMDQSTPHAVAYVAPIRDGKLNAKSWLGRRKRLQKLQDSYAIAVQGLGLERGIRGSEASHERVRRFYGAMKQGADRAHKRVEELRANGILTVSQYADRLETAIEQLETKKTVIEHQRELSLSRELHRRTGLTLPRSATTYVGQLVVLAKDFCIQKAESFGFVLHSLKGLVERTCRDYLDLLFKDRSALGFAYDDKGQLRINEVADELALDHEPSDLTPGR